MRNTVEILVFRVILRLVPVALVCEDDRSIRELVETILHQGGLLVDVVPNGMEALRKLLERDYDVIVLDLMMPEMTGQDVIAQLEHDRPELLPSIVVITADFKGMRALPQTLGAVILKPFDLDQFIEAILRISHT